MANAHHSHRYVVLGLGSFGGSLARRLAENGQRVTGADISERAVDAIKDDIYEAVVADATNADVLEELEVEHARAVIISLGDYLERSVLAALHVVELGATRILAKGINDDHKKILERIGVGEVVFPETSYAIQMADQFTWSNMLSRLALDEDFSIAELEVPERFVGRTLMELNLRRKQGIEVLAFRSAEDGNVQPIPDANRPIPEGCSLVVVASNDDLNKFREVYK